MIKGFRFTNQLANAEVDARIHQEFLNKNDGIFYGMELSKTTNSITISEGLCEIAGRPVAVVDSETIAVGTDSLYCVLVLEIDLSKESTKDTFSQVSFKLLTSSTGYSNVTQQDINKYAGSYNVYQLEFARFKTGTNGIIDFKDTRKFLDFNSIYEEIRQEIQNIEDGSIYILKSDINIITAYLTESTVSITGDNQTIALSGVTKVGNKLSTSNGGIVIGKGIQNVKITGAIFFQEFEKGNGYFFPQIRKNGTDVAAVIEQKGLNGSASFQTVNFSSFLLEVKEGDVITLNSGDINQTPCKVRGGTNMVTFVTVEAVN